MFIIQIAIFEKIIGLDAKVKVFAIKIITGLIFKINNKNKNIKQIL